MSVIPTTTTTNTTLSLGDRDLKTLKALKVKQIHYISLLRWKQIEDPDRYGLIKFFLILR